MEEDAPAATAKKGRERARGDAEAPAGTAGAGRGREARADISCSKEIWAGSKARRSASVCPSPWHTDAYVGDGFVPPVYPTRDATTPGSRSYRACGFQNQPLAMTACSRRAAPAPHARFGHTRPSSAGGSTARAPGPCMGQPKLGGET